MHAIVSAQSPILVPALSSTPSYSSNSKHSVNLHRLYEERYSHTLVEGLCLVLTGNISERSLVLNVGRQLPNSGIGVWLHSDLWFDQWDFYLWERKGSRKEMTILALEKMTEDHWRWWAGVELFRYQWQLSPPSLSTYIKPSNKHLYNVNRQLV